MGRRMKAGDGLILSSFQILDQAENDSTRDAKENRVLDHFLNSLSYENETHFKEENSQWKGSESLPSSSQAQNVSNPFPLDLDGMEDHDNAMLRNFQAQPVNREISQNGNHPGNDNDIQTKKSDGEEEDDDEEEEEDEERRGIMHCQEQRSDLVKGLPLPGEDACNPIQLHGEQSEESAQAKQMIPSHQTDYLDMQPVLSHPVYIDSATDDIWHQDSTKNDFCSTLKPDRQQQQHNDCLTASDWGDSGKGVTKKGELPPAGLENHGASQAQQWDFLHTDEHHEPTHHLLPPPPHHHHHHQPHRHWAAANINTGGIPAVNLSHQHQQHHGQQQQKQWVSGKNVSQTWVHTHPGENGDKAMLPSSGQWSTHNTMAWHKEMGGSFSADTDVGPIHNMFQMTQTQSSDPTVSHTAFPVKGHTIVCNAAISLSPQQAWSMDTHLPTGSGTLYPHQGSHPTMVHCPQPSTTNFFQDPLHLSTASSSPGCHFQGASMQPIACNMAGDSKKARLAFNRRRVVSLSDASVPRCKSTIDQLRPNSHPYLPKDPKIHREGYLSCGNSCNLKASHLVSWYIDYLIHENENLTQISRAFSLPVNLFHSDDFYFMDSVKKKAHFPSLKFLSWMQQKMPNININSVDFLEGRPPVVSMWNQDWFWQNKSRRDIIHDVFFYFQHRRVAYPN